MEGRPKPQILCVDDEPRVVEGLALVLRKDYEVHTASSPEQALQKLREVANLAVVISDMRMPKMDGAMLLHELKVRRPDATRILLTGQADRDEAIRAVNQGQIFRFLSKPCPPDQLKTAIDAGVVQHRPVLAERNSATPTRPLPSSWHFTSRIHHRLLAASLLAALLPAQGHAVIL